MRIEDKKYVWWGLLGIGVAAFFYFLSSRNKGTSTNVQVPYLVPQMSNGASPSAGPSLSNQPNIVGSSPNSTVANYSNPYGVATSWAEVPNTYGFLPNLTATGPKDPANNVTIPYILQPQGAISFQNGIGVPGSNYGINWNYGPNPGGGQPYIPA